MSKVIQSGRSLGAFLMQISCSIEESCVPLAMNLLAPLATMGSASTIDSAIQRKMPRVIRAGKGIMLVISGQYMDDIIRTIKSLENSGVLIDLVKQ